MEKINGGLSNEVFKFNNLIFKLYNYSLLELNYEFEEFIQTKLYHKYHNVPEIAQSIRVDGKLIGRVEKYINSSNVSKEHFTTHFPTYAKLLNNIHSIDVSEKEFQKGKIPNFFIYINNWMCLLDEHIKSNTMNIIQLVPEYYNIKEKAEKYVYGLVEFATFMQMEMKLCHNDFQQLNILVDASNKFYVIDFEYASLNYIYYDIANYFAECALDNTQLKYNIKLYPSKEKRLDFYKEYFNNEYPNEYYEEFDFLVSQFCPLVEFTWFVWTILKYISTKSSDYLTYGKIRLDNFIKLIESSS